MSGRNPLQPTAEPVQLEIERGTVLVENSWVKPERVESLVAVKRSEDMLVLRMPWWRFVLASCAFVICWLALLGSSANFLTVPAGSANIWAILGALAPSAICLYWFVKESIGVWRQVKSRSYFDRSNGQIRLGPLENSPCYQLQDVVAIQFLSEGPSRLESRQLNLVLVTEESSTQRVNLQTGVMPMRRTANRLAEFLDVPLVEQYIPTKTRDKKPARAMKNLDGTWLLIEADGHPIPKEELVRTMVRKGSDFRVKRGQDITLQGRFIIDPAQEPMQIDITPITGRDRGKTCQGIYSLEDDIYKECFAELDQPRPTEFQFRPGISRLRVYRRIK